MSVEYTCSDGIAVVTLNRPDRFNSIDVDLARDLIDAMDQAGQESRAVILTGSGRAFCAGANLAALEPFYEDGGAPDFAALLEDVFHPMVHAVTGASVPVVGAINGVAAGAGMGLALGCDIRVMADDAYFTSAFTAIGLSPDSGSTYWLPQHVGISRAIEIAMTNRRVIAEEALQLGLTAEVCPGDELIDRALARAGQLADLVPDSLVATRNLIRGGASGSFADALEAEKVSQARLGSRPEHREGVMAFLEKRQADFRRAAE